MPVLPPTDESTCARSVVGTCTKSRPRRTQEAAKPDLGPAQAAAESSAKTPELPAPANVPSDLQDVVKNAEGKLVLKTLATIVENNQGRFVNECRMQ